MRQTLDALEEIHKQIEWLNGRIPGVVMSARAQGATWAQVGSALGISPQGAQKRFRPIEVRPESRPQTSETE